MQIYKDVGVSLLRFKYPATLKKGLLEMEQYKINFSQTMLSSKKYPFPYAEKKSKEFYCRCYVVKFSYTFRFSFSPLSFLYLLLCEEFSLFFRWLASF